MELQKIHYHILKVFMESDWEYAYYYSHFETEEFDKKSLQKAMKDLRKLGYVYHATGLFDDDGYTAGSGNSLEYSKRHEVQKLVEDYSGKTS